MSRLQNQNGSILISALVLVSLLTMVGMASVRTGSTELGIAVNEMRATKAFYLAEAGLEYAKAAMAESLFNDASRSSVTEVVPLADGLIQVTVTKIPDTKSCRVESMGILEATAVAPRATRAVSATLEFDDSVLEHVMGMLDNEVDVTIFKQATIIGDLYFGGNVNFQQNKATIDGHVYAGGKILGGSLPTERRHEDLRYAELIVDESKLNPTASYTGPKEIDVGDLESNALIYINGNATVSGVVTGKNITIFASGVLTVERDLSYANAAAGPLHLIGKTGIDLISTKHKDDKGNDKVLELVGWFYTPGVLLIDGEISLLGSLVCRTLDTHQDRLKKVTLIYDTSREPQLPLELLRAITKDWQEKHSISY